MKYRVIAPEPQCHPQLGWLRYGETGEGPDALITILIDGGLLEAADPPPVAPAEEG